MNKQRLLKLAEVLENFDTERKNLVVPVGAFDMGTWANGLAMNGALHRRESCGTAACAMGTAMLHPWFRRRGLQVGMEHGPGFGTSPYFDGWTGFSAAEAFFGIDHYESNHLFDDSAYPRTRRGPKSVAKRIRAFVADGGLVSAMSAQFGHGSTTTTLSEYLQDRPWPHAYRDDIPELSLGQCRAVKNGAQCNLDAPHCDETHVDLDDNRWD
jgi:hypothetical protein